MNQPGIQLEYPVIGGADMQQYPGYWEFEKSPQMYLPHGKEVFDAKYGNFYWDYIKTTFDPQILQNLRVEILGYAYELKGEQNPEAIEEFAKGLELEPNLSTLLMMDLFLILGVRVTENSTENVILSEDIKLIQNDRHRITAYKALNTPPTKRYNRKNKTPNDYLKILGFEIVKTGHARKTEYWLQEIGSTFTTERWN